MLNERNRSATHVGGASVAAKVFLGLATVVVAFQLALTAGAPWGHLTMGGAFPGQLPPRMRAVAFLQAILLTCFTAIVGIRAGLVLPRWKTMSRKLIWVIVGYAVVGTVMNAITPSAGERALWLPVVIVLGVCAVLVARVD